MRVCLRWLRDFALARAPYRRARAQRLSPRALTWVYAVSVLSGILTYSVRTRAGARTSPRVLKSDPPGSGVPPLPLCVAPCDTLSLSPSLTPSFSPSFSFPVPSSLVISLPPSPSLSTISISFAIALLEEEDSSGLFFSWQLQKIF